VENEGKKEGSVRKAWRCNLQGKKERSEEGKLETVREKKQRRRGVFDPKKKKSIIADGQDGYKRGRGKKEERSRNWFLCKGECTAGQAGGGNPF